MVSMFLSLFIVIFLIFGMAWLYKKTVLRMPGSDAIKVITSLQLGTKERLLVVEINGKQHVLGVTSQQINYLVALDEPVEMPDMSGDFKTQLIKMMGNKREQ